MSERDCALFQRGCVTGQDGVPRDISLLGDPRFKPYEESTLQPRWEARGGSLHLSLGDIRDRWGEEVALEVHRCAIELDRYDASRRLGIELPWFALEKRELQPSEIIRLMEREIGARADEVRSDGGRSDTGLHSIDSPESPDPDETMRRSRRTTREGISTPTLSVMESVISTGTVTSTEPDNIGCADDDHDLERYGWSLADADIEQLLQAGKAGGSRFLSSSQVAASEDIDSESEVDNEEEALLELLEEEVTGSLGLLSPSPDISIGTPL
jgi:hypothetical protein